jgi:hypothetical protein
MDEKGFMQGKYQKQKVLVKARHRLKDKFAGTPGNKD